MRQAEQYAEGLEARFEQIAEQPNLYPAADHIKPGYRLSVYISHTIYYRADEHEVLIVRIHPQSGTKYSVDRRPRRVMQYCFAR